MGRWGAVLLLGALCLAVTAAGSASADAGPVGGAHAAGAAALLESIVAEYEAADPTHDAVRAGHARRLADALRGQVGEWRVRPAARSGAEELAVALALTRDRLRPWPLPQRIEALAAGLGRTLRTAGVPARTGARPYGEIESLLGAAEASFATGNRTEAKVDAAEAYALFAAGPAPRLQASNPALAAAVTAAFERTGGGGPSAIAALGDEIDTAATALGDRSAGSATVVADAAVIVFREGLEAVLIVAAVTAAFVGERRRLRRPVLLGALLGLAASAVTYVLAQAVVAALGDGGLRLQAITGLLAIAVLLVVTNWFFHRLYWSEWIGRFHRRRRALERLDRRGFLSGQVAALVLLGLTSVYREGFETVLFLQNLQVSAGTHATLLGVAIGLGATLAVGFVTFRLERKLPYKRMLIATGILIGLVLAVMVGTTVHTMQGLGWVPSTPTGFALPPWCNRWLGAFPTWEGLGAQLAGLLVVFGSYALARWVQGGASRRRGSADASIQGEGALG